MPPVFLVHGLWMSGYASLLWQRGLLGAGFAAEIFSYQSVFKTLDANADALCQSLLAPQWRQRMQPIHLVGHSLGGLLILHTLRRHRSVLESAIGRVVLCGSPVNGSHCARQGRQWPVLGKTLGHSIVQWQGIDAAELPQSVEVGVIAGTRPYGLGRVVPGLPQPNDGTVALSETALPFARDSIALALTHSQLLMSPTVPKHIAHFLRLATFKHHV